MYAEGLRTHCKTGACSLQGSRDCEISVGGILVHWVILYVREFQTNTWTFAYLPTPIYLSAVCNSVLTDQEIQRNCFQYVV